nr:glutamine synthetase type III [Candidatus Omnitrophota bacterium]
AKDVNKEAAAIVKEYISKYGRVIYNGNNYSAEWVKEAKKRGLPNISSMVEAMDCVTLPAKVKMFEKYKVLSKTELHSRQEVYLEKYCKDINIEARASIDMVKRQYLPVVMKYAGELAQTISSLKSAGALTSATVQKSTLAAVSKLLASASKNLAALEAVTTKAQDTADTHAKSKSFRDKVVPAQLALRADIDALEQIVPASQWPVPTYADMLFKL